jgi:fructoselysine-6-P-deglycase FrlB-like protein
MADAYAVARESAGAGETDAFAASEAPAGRRYDAVLAISRSGTTTEVVSALEALPASVPTYAIVGVARTPIATTVDHPVVLDFADEQSVVQTRFATTALVYLLAGLELDVEAAAADAELALAAELPLDPAAARAFVFLGRGWTVGLSAEAALKLREAALAWAEAYPALEYRHGPIALAAPGTVVWPLGEVARSTVTCSTRSGRPARRSWPVAAIRSPSSSSCSGRQSRSPKHDHSIPASLVISLDRLSCGS